MQSYDLHEYRKYVNVFFLHQTLQIIYGIKNTEDTETIRHKDEINWQLQWETGRCYILIQPRTDSRIAYTESRRQECISYIRVDESDQYFR